MSGELRCGSNPRPILMVESVFPAGHTHAHILRNPWHDQHVQQKCDTEIPGINGKASIHIQEKCGTEAPGIHDMASMFSRSVAQRFQKSMAWPAYSAEVWPRDPRNPWHGQHVQEKCDTESP